MKRLIENVRVVFPGERIVNGSVLVEDRKIARIHPDATALSEGVQRIDGEGRLLTPGLIDMHTHGVKTFNYDNGPDDILAACEALPGFGVTAFVPTLVPRPGKNLERQLAEAASALDRAKGAKPLGLHLEGPFVALAGAGCRPTPGDVSLLDDMLDACAGRATIMSISPDVDGIVPVIERMCERGVVPFITHTRANIDQAQAAIDAGARHATHFYDVFYPPEETDIGVRPVGVVEAILAEPRASCDFIADGVHVHPVAIRAALAAKGYQGVMLITDANIGAGMPPGVYETPWGYPVRVAENDAARIDDPSHEYYGALAGSALTMNVGVKNLLAWLDLPPARVWAMATSNPARLLGLETKGTMRVGADADLVLWNEDLTPARVWVGGEEVFSSSP